RGTTHISAIDAARNIASLTATNGEGCGELLPGAGFMLNNMLGEESVNPRGCDRWRPDRRMSSLMAPSLLLGDGAAIALGSGGSNRIPGAILQVVCNLVDFGLDADAAIARARLHIEDGAMHREADFPAPGAQALARDFPGHRTFERANMFFGGVHAAGLDRRGELLAVGDARRDGVGVVVV
ncbi:MAG: gamma-glutamyltransferase, partial [bacterium]